MSDSADHALIFEHVYMHSNDACCNPNPTLSSSTIPGGMLSAAAAAVDPVPCFDRKKVIQGTCGWTDQSLIKCGKFYPKKSAKSSERLEFYSRQGGFGCVEVDCSSYALQNEDTVQAWVSATPKVSLLTSPSVLSGLSIAIIFIIFIY